MESYILMNNYSNILFPEIISETFPILDGASYLHQLASLVPFCPDTAFHIFDTKNGHFHVLVMTNYPDPYHQAKELEQISGEYKMNSSTSSNHTPTTNISKSAKTTISTNYYS